MVDITTVLQAGLGLIATLITAFIIPWIKSKLSAEKQAMLAYWVDKAVAAAEQRLKGTGRGSEKLAFVVAFLESKGYTINLKETTDEIWLMIEAAVLALDSDG